MTFCEFVDLIRIAAYRKRTGGWGLRTG